MVLAAFPADEEIRFPLSLDKQSGRRCEAIHTAMDWNPRRSILEVSAPLGLHCTIFRNKDNSRTMKYEASLLCKGKTNEVHL